MADGKPEGAILNRRCLTCGARYSESTAACPSDGTMLVPVADDSLIGSTFADRYEVVSIIGEGGMGVVYLARHQLMDRLVAIKMLHAHLVSNATSLKRFQQEARTASLLTHPNIITVHDFGVTDDGRPYLILDYVQGRGLKEVIEQEGLLSPERVVRISSQVCDGLSLAHSKGVIHRDLKPSNIMLLKDGQDEVKLLDFGIAKLLPQSGIQSQSLTASGEVFGTPLYMAPEQILGFPTDARSDIYALGCVIYEVLCGSPPFTGHSLFDTMQKHISEPIHPFSRYKTDLYVPEKLQSVIFKAMAKEPADRQQTMLELKEELQNTIDTPKIEVTSATVVPPQKIARFSFATRVSILLAAVLITAVGTGLVSRQIGSQRQEKWQRLDEAAQIALDKGNYAQSEKISNQALEIAQTFGNTDARLADTWDRLGQIEHHQKNNVQAKEYLLKALSIRQKLWGANNPKVADTLVHLAMVYRNLDPAKAAEALDKALAIQKGIFGEKSLQVAYVLAQKALLHEHIGNLNEAEAQYERIVPLIDANTPDDDPEFLRVIRSYVRLLRQLHKNERADKLESQYK